MTQEKPNRLAEWTVLLRQQVPVVRRYVTEWAEACRREPRLIWETRPVRYAAYLMGGLIALWGVLAVMYAIAPPLPTGTKPEATGADYHVLCSNPRCRYHFVIHRTFGFSKFPVQCPRCKRKTGEQARRCYSQACQGAWVIPVDRDGVVVCSVCGEPFE